MTFQELQLLPSILRAVGEMGYECPSPIQAAAIPHVLAGRDLIGCAQTGTGKTAAFAIPILQRLQGRIGREHKPIRALILTPTRELALQIQENFTQYGKYLPVRTAVIFGGVGQTPQIEAVQAGVDVLVATPGRLMDLRNQGHIDLTKLDMFVLDEADRMLDMGFIRDVRKIISWLPQKRQTLLFSATMPREIAELSQTLLKDPIRVEVTPQSSTVDAIRQKLYRVEQAEKKNLLQEVLRDESLTSVLVFTNTKHRANRVAELLNGAGIPAMAIHGNKSQSARVLALSSFKEGTIRALVATDIAARGIDVSGLPCVINFELPNVPETYVHRIGRTGRAGRPGLAISFCNREEEAYLRDIEKLIGKKVPVVRDHALPVVETPVKKTPEPKAPETPVRKSIPAGELSTGQGGQKLRLEPLPPPRTLPPEPPKPRRTLRSDPWVPGRVVASADGRSGKRRSRSREK
ncbi:MAG: DEAD/DEAH box helicase [Firmicutes bacterium]|nr:DEAD/DEAH box helicase [Bacillota bacterium]